MRRMLTDADIAKLSSGVEWALDEPEKGGKEFSNVRYGIYQISVGGYQGNAKLVALYKAASDVIEITIAPALPNGIGTIYQIDYNSTKKTLSCANGDFILKPICYFE